MNMDACEHGACALNGVVLWFPVLPHPDLPYAQVLGAGTSSSGLKSGSKSAGFLQRLFDTSECWRRQTKAVCSWL